MAEFVRASSEYLNSQPPNVDGSDFKPLSCYIAQRADGGTELYYYEGDLPGDAPLPAFGWSRPLSEEERAWLLNNLPRVFRPT